MPRSECCLVQHNGDIYAIGGISRNDTTIQDVERYSTMNKDWSMLPPLSREGCHVGKTSAVTFGGKLLVYAAVDRNRWTDAGSGTGANSVTHNLMVYDEPTQSWRVILTDKHNQGSYPSSLLVHDNRCYRVIYGNCRCPAKNLGCKWHCIRVQEILFGDDKLTIFSAAHLGEPVHQDDRHLVAAAFCIDDEVFVGISGTLHNTGRRTDRTSNLSKWEWTNTIGIENNVVRLTFDKALLE